MDPNSWRWETRRTKKEEIIQNRWPLITIRSHREVFLSRVEQTILWTKITLKARSGVKRVIEATQIIMTMGRALSAKHRAEDLPLAPSTRNITINTLKACWNRINWHMKESMLWGLWPKIWPRLYKFQSNLTRLGVRMCHRNLAQEWPMDLTLSTTWGSLSRRIRTSIGKIEIYTVNTPFLQQLSSKSQFQSTFTQISSRMRFIMRFRDWTFPAKNLVCSWIRLGNLTTGQTLLILIWCLLKRAITATWLCQLIIAVHALTRKSQPNSSSFISIRDGGLHDRNRFRKSVSSRLHMSCTSHTDLADGAVLVFIIRRCTRHVCKLNTCKECIRVPRSWW